MTSSTPLRAAALGLAAGVLAAAPAPAAQRLADASLSAAGTTARACQDGLADGRGLVRQTLRATTNGLLQARLSGGHGDWDVAVYNASTEHLVAASASRGSVELAEGFVGAGDRLVVQACRLRGAGGVVDLTATLTPTGKAPEGKISLVRVSVPTEGAEQALESLDLDLTEHAREGIRDAVLYGTADALKLTKAGLRFTTLVADLPAATRRSLALEPGPGSATVPSGRTEYRRLADYGTDMKKLATENPTLVKPLTLEHKSLEGRPVEGIEISKDVAAKDGKPVFLQMGVHHAREWPSGEHALEFAFDLVNKFKAGDARTVGLLEKARVIVVPVVNPDGFNLSRESIIDSRQPLVDPAFAYKRRNCRIVDFELPAPGQCGMQANRNRGTDPNRNYGGLWGGRGASSSPTSDTYRGAGPFSEPETQNVQALVSARQVTTLITNHTYSDLVLRPPGVEAQGLTPDEPVYKALGDAMAAENGYTSQKSWELYDTTGTTEDWSYFATGGLGFTFEIGKAASGPTGLETLVGVGFHPPFPLGVAVEYSGKYPGGGGNREAYFTALEHTADAGNHAVLEGRGPEGATIRLFKTFRTFATAEDEETGETISFQDTLETTHEIPASRRFSIHANPSTRPSVRKLDEDATESWRVTCEKRGELLGQQEVVVERGQTVRLEDICG